MFMDCNEREEENTKSDMTDLSPIILIITLHISGPSKRIKGKDYLIG